MKTDGETFKELREARHICQKTIAGNKLSRTSISKFENNKVNLTTNHFYFLLENLDMSLEEFHYIKNDYSYSEKERIILLFNQIFSSSENDSIIDLIILCEKYLQKKCSKSITCILKTLYALKYMNNQNDYKLNCLSKIYIADVWNILSEIDIWTILDLKIINCCLHFFEPSSYIPISEQIILSLNKYKNFTNIILLETSLYLNLTILFLLENNIEYAKKFSGISLQKAYKSKRIDYIAISLIRKGIIYNETNNISKGLSLLDILDNSDLKNSMKDEIEHFNFSYK